VTGDPDDREAAVSTAGEQVRRALAAQGIVLDDEEAVAVAAFTRPAAGPPRQAGLAGTEPEMTFDPRWRP
jgi:hypothetical protein